MASTMQSTIIPTPTFFSKSEQPEILTNDDLARRKRITTAERRATHNAVERARRETLNGRFLHLASLLPNLSQIRRPSKSAIVNSSIAHVNASKRHRMMAARVTQDLLREADDLRREVNEWRERAGIRKVEPRVISNNEGMNLVLRAELEPISISHLDEDDEEEYYHQHHMASAAAYAAAPRPPLMQRHTAYGPTMQTHPVPIPSAPVHYEAHPAHGYAPSHQQMVAAPVTSLPSPPAAPPAHHSPHATHHAAAYNNADPYMTSHHDAEKAYYAPAVPHIQVQPSRIVAHSNQWSDESSPTAYNHSPPSSPSSFEPVSSGSRHSFEFGAYEQYEGAGYDLVGAPSSSYGSSEDGFVPRGLSGQTLLPGSQPMISAEHFGMMAVV